MGVLDYLMNRWAITDAAPVSEPAPTERFYAPVNMGEEFHGRFRVTQDIIHTSADPWTIKTTVPAYFDTKSDVERYLEMQEMQLAEQGFLVMHAGRKTWNGRGYF